MKRLLLLFLSLMTGCEASKVKGCRGGWVNLTRGYPEKDQIYTSINVDWDNDEDKHGNRKIIETNKKNVWISEGRFSVYHDDKSKDLRVGIKDIQREDFGEYKLKFRTDKKRRNEDKEVELKLDNRCQEPLHQTAYRTDKINISCDYKIKDDDSMFFCKENGPICEDILSTKIHQRTNRTFTLTETESGFTVSISNVSPQHAGVYWCGVEITKGKKKGRATLREIQLKVKEKTTKKTSTSHPPTTVSPTASSTGSSTDSPTDSPTGSPTASSTVSTTQSNSAQKDGVSWIPRVAAVVCVALLGLLLFLVFRYKHSCCSKNKRKGEAHNMEDHAYDEIQERPQVTGPGTALQSLYVTANAPTNPSASLDYSTITAHNTSAEAGGETYSTVRDQAQSVAYSTVNHPLPGDPLYSSVNHPQQT